MVKQNKYLIILGINTKGVVFRPSDWADRLCGCLSAFDKNQRLNYSPYVRPVLFNAVKSVKISMKLAEIDPLIFDFLVVFFHRRYQ